MTPGSARIGGWLLTAIGIIYVLKPNLFSWIDSLDRRMLSPKGYLRYVRWVGVLCVAAGIILLYLGYGQS